MPRDECDHEQNLRSARALAFPKNERTLAPGLVPTPAPCSTGAAPIDEDAADPAHLDLAARSKRLRALRSEAANRVLLAREGLERPGALGLPAIAKHANALALARHADLEALQVEFAAERAKRSDS